MTQQITTNATVQTIAINATAAVIVDRASLGYRLHLGKPLSEGHRAKRMTTGRSRLERESMPSSRRSMFPVSRVPVPAMECDVPAAAWAALVVSRAASL
jgi:hypothetical protein